MGTRLKKIGCPAETTLNIIKGQWKLLILRELHEGVNRFGELHRALPGISQKVLTQHLRELERDGIIYRQIHDQVPPKVEYFLTPLGQTLKPIIDALHEWGLKYEKEFLARG